MSPTFCQHCAKGEYSWFAPGCVLGKYRFKVPHPTIEAAWKAVESVSRNYPNPPGTRLNAYKCRYAGHYHIGHVRYLPALVTTVTSPDNLSKQTIYKSKFYLLR